MSKRSLYIPTSYDEKPVFNVSTGASEHHTKREMERIAKMTNEHIRSHPSQQCWKLNNNWYAKISNGELEFAHDPDGKGTYLPYFGMAVSSSVFEKIYMVLDGNTNSYKSMPLDLVREKYQIAKEKMVNTKMSAFWIIDKEWTAWINDNEKISFIHCDVGKKNVALENLITYQPTRSY